MINIRVYAEQSIPNWMKVGTIPPGDTSDGIATCDIERAREIHIRPKGFNFMDWAVDSFVHERPLGAVPFKKSDA
jgi:hypothetical protein